MVIESRPEDAEDLDEWLKAEGEGAPRAPPGAGVIVVDDGGVSIVTGALCRKTDPKIATAPKTQSKSKDQNKDKDNSK